jgi:hypothetical protein
MFGNQYYHSIIRKYVIAFGNLFNDIVIQRLDKDGNRIQTIAVPLSYSPKDKYIARLRQDPNLDQDVAITLPRMGFEITSFNYAPERKLASTLRNINVPSEGSSTVSAQYVPVPYDITFSLYSFVKNTEDGTQILEQILPYFRPEFTTNVKIIPDMNISVDAPVILNSVSPEDLYEGDFQTRQALIHTLDFTLKGYMYGPIVNKGVITRAIANFYSDTENTQLIEKIVVTPAGTVIDTEGFGFSSSASSTVAYSPSVTNTHELRLFDNDESNFITLKTLDQMYENYTLRFPPNAGAPGEVLRSDGNGNLIWLGNEQGPFGPKSITIAFPTIEENLTLLKTNQSLPIARISSVLSTTGAGSVSFDIRYDTDRSGAGTEIKTGGFTATSNTVGETTTSLDNSIIGINNWVWLDITGISGIVKEFHITIDFT